MADPTQIHLTQVVQLEPSVDRPGQLGPNQHRAGFGMLLQASGQIDGVTQRVEPLAVVARLPVDHHSAGLDRDPPGQRQVVVGAHLLAEAVEFALKLDPGQHRALGIVIVGLGRSEHGEHAIPGELGHGSPEAAYLSGDQAGDLVKQQL